MGKDSKIEWTKHTFNPWWGCQKVSPACTNCYAEGVAGRFHPSEQLWGPGATRRPASDAMWRKPLAWNRAAERAGERHRVFCASMADVFENRRDLDAMRLRLFALIEETPHLDWLLLTKRPKSMYHYSTGLTAQRDVAGIGNGWPPNAWAGTTVENQATADERIPWLLKVPARVRFLSCEPLLSQAQLLDLHLGEYRTVNCGGCESGGHDEYGDEMADCPGHGAGGIHWVIAGGESGPKARPSHPDWFRSLRDQCQSAGVPFHFKQWGEWCPRSSGYPFTEGPRGRLTLCGCNGSSDLPIHGVRGAYTGAHQCDTSGDSWMGRVGKKAAGRILDGRTWDEFPIADSIRSR